MKCDNISMHSKNKQETQALLSVYINFDYFGIAFKDIQAFATKKAGEYLDKNKIAIRRWAIIRVDDIAEGKQLYVYKLFLRKCK